MSILIVKVISKDLELIFIELFSFSSPCTSVPIVLLATFIDFFKFSSQELKESYK